MKVGRSMIKEWCKLLRIKHYIKNLLIFMPAFFGGALFHYEVVLNGTMGFGCFCLLSSVIYILNDYRDIEKDRNHPKKKKRPLASGAIRPDVAFIVACFLLIFVIGISIVLNSWQGAVCLAIYFVLNIAYSMGLKNKPIIDVVILASGFVIRVFYGGFVCGIDISKWLYLVVTTGSLYMGLGKRRNELKAQTDTREVLKYYTEAFLDKNMHVCVALADVFYALWTLELPNQWISWTVPLFIIMLMCYSLNTEGDSDGDPIEVILKDKVLIGVILTYGLCMFSMLYIF